MLSKKISVLASCILIAGLSITGCSRASTSTSSDTSSSAADSAGGKNDTGSKKSEKKNTRTLEISATATGDGTVLHGATGSSNSEKFTGEWSKTVELPKDEGYTVSVTGDIFNSDDSQQVSCKIIVDGKVEEEKTGSGSAGSAFCNVSPKYF